MKYFIKCYWMVGNLLGQFVIRLSVVIEIHKNCCFAVVHWPIWLFFSCSTPTKAIMIWYTKRRMWLGRSVISNKILMIKLVDTWSRFVVLIIIMNIFVTKYFWCPVSRRRVKEKTQSTDNRYTQFTPVS